MSQTIEEQVVEALYAIPTPSDREPWIKFGMSLHHILGPDGIDAWHEWSSRGDNYEYHHADAVYRSFKPTKKGVTEKTIFKAARALGWRPSGKAVESSPEEKQAREEAYQKAEEERVAAQAGAAEKAKTVWEGAEEAQDHPYLEDKGVKPTGLRQSKGKLLLPLYHDGDLCNLQFIDEEGNKKFLKGGRVKGAYLLLGEIEDEVYIAEGWATACSLHDILGKPVCVAMNAGNLPDVASNLREQYPDAAICICADADPVGKRKAEIAALAVDGRVVVPEVANVDEVSDFNDMAMICTPEEVQEAFEPKEPEEPDEFLDRLSNDEDKIAHARQELQKAKGLDDLAKGVALDRIQGRTGITKATLKAELRKIEQEGKADNVVPMFDGPVSGAALAREILNLINKHMFLANDEAVQITLWVMNTWVFDSLDILPKLNISSPVPGCGKSILALIIEAVCSKPLIASNASAAAIFRLIEIDKPTLILDECDAFLNDSDEIRCILNSGHTRRTAHVLRCVGEDSQPQKFATYTPTVLAGIGKKAATLEDRSIMVRLVKVNGAKRPPRLPLRFFEDQEHLRQKLAKWASTAKVSFQEIEATDNPRSHDNWSVLWSIAQELGEEWPGLCLDAYRKECQREASDEVLATLLLQDIHNIFMEDNDDITVIDGLKRISGSVLVTLLNAKEESPWHEMGKDGITQSRLSKMLSEFQIKPKQMKFGDSNVRGYCESMFSQAFEAYLVEEVAEEPETADVVDIVI